MWQWPIYTYSIWIVGVDGSLLMVMPATADCCRARCRNASAKLLVFTAIVVLPLDTTDAFDMLALSISWLPRPVVFISLLVTTGVAAIAAATKGANV